MRGSIMPEPFAMPPTENVPAGVSTRTANDFGNGSVVMIARVAASDPATSSARPADCTPFRIFSRLRCTPITPVDATSTCSLAQPTVAAVAAAIALAALRPTSPVQALAQPLFTTTA